MAITYNGMLIAHNIRRYGHSFLESEYIPLINMKECISLILGVNNPSIILLGVLGFLFDVLYHHAGLLKHDFLSLHDQFLLHPEYTFLNDVEVVTRLAFGVNDSAARVRNFPKF